MFSLEDEKNINHKGCYPCGYIPLFSQLFGTEDVSQVHGILCDFFEANPRHCIRKLLYDDMCHLKRFAEKPEQANKNEITKKLAEVSKHVDKFHFREAVKKTVLFRNNS